MKSITLLKLLLVINVFILHSNMQAQQEWETVPLNSYKWQISQELSIQSNTITNLKIENLNVQDKEKKKDNLIDFYTATLNLNKKESRPFEITFRIDNQNNNPFSYKYRVYEKDKKRWYRGNIHWGIRVEFYGMDGTQVSNKVWFNVYRGNYRNGYQINKNNSGWQDQGYSSVHTVFIKKGDDNSLKFYIDYESSDNLIGGWTNIAGIKQITIMAGTASNVEVTDLKMQRKTMYGIVKPIVDKGDEYFRKEMYINAVKEYTDAIIQGYNNADIFIKRARANASREYYVNAIEDCTSALYYDKNNKDAYYIRGLCKLYNNDDSGVEDLRKAGAEGIAILKEYGLIDYNSNKISDDNYNKAIDYTNQGIKYSNQNNHKQAIAYYSMALSINPDYYWANNNIGYTYFLLGDYDRAIPYLLKAIKSQPNNPFAYSNIGGCYVGLGEYNKAISYCQKAIEVKDKYNSNPNESSFYDGEPYYFMALAYAELNDEKAYPYLVKAAQLGDENAIELLKELEKSTNSSSQQKTRSMQNGLKKDPNFKIE